MSKLLLECSRQQLHNDIIALSDDGGLLGAIHADTNDMIISDTIIRSLVPPQLRPITDHQKLCVVVPFVTFKIFSGIVKFMATETIRNHEI